MVSSPAGRLSPFLEEWRRLTSDSRILKWIKGYKIPFSESVIQRAIPKKPAWSNKERSLITDHINKLVLKGAVSKCSPCEGQFISSIFLIPKPDGSSRLILNLKKLNEFIETEHFKLEDLKIACKLVSHNCFMGKLDFEDAYYMIPIDREYKKWERPV